MDIVQIILTIVFFIIGWVMADYIKWRIRFWKAEHNYRLAAQDEAKKYWSE